MKRIFLTLSAFFLFHFVYGQCAMCKAVAEDSAADEGSTINKAILYIMVIPYIILFIAFRKYIVNIFRRIRNIPMDNKRL